jgi:hypothetical protein
MGMHTGVGAGGGGLVRVWSGSVFRPPQVAASHSKQDLLACKHMTCTEDAIGSMSSKPVTRSIGSYPDPGGVGE